VYPEHGDPDFARKLMSLKEYQTFRIPETPVIKTEAAFVKMTEKVCTSFDKLHQHFVEHYLSVRSPYRSILLYHSLGVGKTCSAITVAEAMLAGHTRSDGPRILVISSSALKKSFIEQIRGECTEGYYQKLTGSNPKRMNDLIKSRYKFITYDGIVAYTKECKGELRNTTVIIDEAHNLRMEDTEKESSKILEKFIKKNANRGNRLVLLSATPMYDKPQEILWLLGLLMRNDGRKPPVDRDLFGADGILTSAAVEFLQQAASEYISYIKSMNPFAFAKRLGPDASSIPIIQAEWAQPLTDGLVGTPPGDLQITTPINYQAANITFPSGAAPREKKRRSSVMPRRGGRDSDSEGLEGMEAIGKGKEDFLKVFNQRSPTTLSLEYNQGHENALMPTPDKLGRIAAKMLRICDLIRESKGIVLVYSRFIWYGVVPLAIALEHMGLKRYGQPNILAGRPGLVRDPVPPNTAYCILNGDKQIMGSSSIDSCIEVLNSPKNVNGEVIKVVLITQVAGEGLSLRNVREVHILEPWFHMNRMNQVIGRGLRTCSHVGLPLRDRNMTVFLHAIDDTNSADLEVYQNIVIPKLTKIQQIEDLVRSSALDCDIMRNMNLYERGKFPFVVTMETSRGASVAVQFGTDAAAGGLQCRSVGTPHPSPKTFVKDIFVHLVPLAVKRIVAYVKRHGGYWVAFKDIYDNVALDRAIVDVAIPSLLYPNRVLAGHRLYLHTFTAPGIAVIPDAAAPGPGRAAQAAQLVKLPTRERERAAKQDDENGTAALLAKIPMDDPAITIFVMYTEVDEAQWPEFAQHVVATGHPLATLSVTRAHGVFVYASELGRGSATTPIGYVNIFNKDAFEAFVLGTVAGAGGTEFRAATSSETALIMTHRKQTWREADIQSTKDIVGLFMPEKRGVAIASNKFKLIKPERAAGKKSGIVCKSLDLPKLRDILTELGKPADSKEKGPMCFTIGFELMRRDRVWTYPQWKPLK
jgi:hypothetical protein